MKFSGIFFVLCIAGLAFIYGAATIQFRIFPYSIFQEAKTGFNAMMALEDDTHSMTIASFDDSAPERPTVTFHAENAGTEPMLITGGFYQNMAECPQFGCLTWITDRSGKILHKWEVDPAVLLEGISGFNETPTAMNVYPVGLALQSDGSLTVSFLGRNLFPYTIGLARFSARGELIWKRIEHSHHWFDVEADGSVYAPALEFPEMTDYHLATTQIVKRCDSGKINNGGVRIYNPDGTLRNEFRIIDAFAESNWHGLFYAVRIPCDPVHINSVQVVSDSIAAQLGGVESGDLLISIREISTVAIVDGETGAVKKLVAGRTAAQHGPQFLPDGTVAVFDNRAGSRDRGGSRIVRLNMENGDAGILFPRKDTGPAVPFFSKDGGHLHVSPDGKRIVVADKHQSRLFEFDVETGEELWVLRQCADAVPYLEALNLKADADRACYLSFGAYYVEDISFIKQAN